MQKRKIYIFAVLLIVLTTFAYSALSTSLSITSEAKLRPISDIRVTKIELDGATNGGLESYSPQFTKDTITNGFVLPNLDSTISYNVTIANNGTIDQAIYDLQTVSSNNNDMIITVDDVPINEALPMIVPFGTYKTIKITYKTNSPSDSVINMVNRFIFKQVYYIDYETKGGSAVATQTKYEDVDLTLEGTPTKNLYVFMGWTDEQNGTIVKYRPGSTYTLNENKTMYAIWRQGEATFLPGGDFNAKIKQLAGNTNATYETADTNITSIQRANTLPNGFTPTSTNIVSTSESDIPIYAWYDNGTIYYYTAVANPYMNSQATNMFRGLTKATSIDLSTINTSRTRYMDAMFQSLYSLENIDLSGFNTSNVTNMSNMFSNCSNLTSINLSSFNTGNVTNMKSMFGGCISLQSINVSSFNTSNVTDMENMFIHCSSLISIDVSSFDTRKVQTMQGMFYGCSSLINLDLSSFYTPELTNMKFIVENCSSLISLNMSNFDTRNIDSLGWTFHGCSSLTSLDISNFDLSNVTNVDAVFYGLSSLQQLKTPNTYPTSLSVNLPNTFYDPSNNAYSALSTGNPTQTWIKLPYTVVFNANTGTGTMPNQVIGVGATTTLTSNAFTKTGYKFVGWNTEANGSGTAYLNNASVSNLGTFNQTVNLYAQWIEGEATFLYGATVNYMMKELAGTDTTSQTYRHNTFDYNIISIERADTLPDNFTPTSDNTLSEESLSDFPIYGWFDNGTLYYYTEASILKTSGSTFSMFRSLMNVENIDVSSFNTSSTYEMGGMFFNCPKLKSIDVSNFDTSIVAGMESMFNMYYDNNYLTILDLSSFRIKDNASISNMLSHMPALEQLKTPSSIGSGVTISLPLTLYDESGNAYTTLSTGDPTETWLRKAYTVTFDPNGGSVSTSSKSVIYNQPYGTLPTPTREGYTFDGWNGKNLFNPQQFYEIGKDYNVYISGNNIILWTYPYQETYTKMYIESKENTQYTLNFDWEVLSSNNEFIQSGLDFVYSDGSYGGMLNKSSVRGSIGDTGHFEETSSINKSLVAISSAGWKYTGQFKFSNIQLEEGTTATAYEPYYVTSSTTVTQDKNHTLTAKWTPNTYTVNYNGNGNTGGTTASSTHTYDVASNLTTNGFTKTGYKFVGWNTRQDGTGTPYLDGASVTRVGTGGEVTLYAQWIEGEATFNYGPTFNYMIKELAGTDTTGQTYRHNKYDYNITSIERASTLPNNFTPTSDNIVSTEDSDYPIYAWYDNGIIYYYTEAINLYMNASAGYMFKGLKSLTSTKINDINTIRTTNMISMFNDCSSLTSLNISTFDMSNVTYAPYMLNNMSSLEQLKTPSAYPSNLTITLPTTLYDTSGNAYTELTSSTPTETWLRKAYTVTYNANGGSVSPASKTAIYGQTYGQLATPTKTNYIFAGWNGKNLLNYNKIRSSAVTYGYSVDANGNISKTGNNDGRVWGYSSSDWHETLSSGTYTLTLLFSTPISSDNTAAGIGIYQNGTTIYGSYDIKEKDKVTLSFTLNETTDIGIMVKSYDGVYKIQLEEGDTSTTWEPYFVTASTTVTQAKDHTLKAIWQENPITFNNQTLNSGVYKVAYTSNAFTAATGGSGNYTYTIKSGAPTGATINSANRTISFTNTTPAGTYNVVVTVTDTSTNISRDATMTIVINSVSADDISYDNTNTGVNCSTVQCMIDELYDLYSN